MSPTQVQTPSHHICTLHQSLALRHCAFVKHQHKKCTEGRHLKIENKMDLYEGQGLRWHWPSLKDVQTVIVSPAAALRTLTVNVNCDIRKDKTRRLEHLTSPASILSTETLAKTATLHRHAGRLHCVTAGRPRASIIVISQSNRHQVDSWDLAVRQSVALRVSSAKFWCYNFRHVLMEILTLVVQTQTAVTANEALLLRCSGW